MQIQYILEILGTGFFAISGSLAANQKSKPDWFGVTFIGFITSIGGGSLRDILLGYYPLTWVKDINFLYAVLVGIILASIFYKPLIKLRKSLFIFETIGISMFTIIGCEKALSLGVHPLVAAIMGMVSAVMGGVLRDVLTNEIPILFRKEIYASACLAGALLYLVLDHFGAERNIAILMSTVFIFMIRIVAIKFNISFPKFRKEDEVSF
jgi:uncharacterized membrane protein YeiH